MYTIAKPIFLKCETPLHAGSGSDLNIVDLPIQRERHTGFPKVEGSSLKGALREHFRLKQNKEITALFGSESDEDTRQAGALGITDARLLFFPVRSVRGLFAWITCPQVLARAAKDLRLCTYQDDHAALFDINGKRLVTPNSPLLMESNKIILEEYAFEVKPSEALQNLTNWLADLFFDEKEEHLNYWNQKVKNSVAVIPDDDFRDFVNLSTEVITRTKINPETGTVEQGALFTEEYLPVESIMYALIFGATEFVNDQETNKESRLKAEDVFQKFQGTMLDHPILQLGGNATLGKGIISTYFLNN